MFDSLLEMNGLAEDLAEEIRELEREGQEYKEFLIEQGIYGPERPALISAHFALFEHPLFDEPPF